ncbi:hypothetical protein ABH931_006160 [Streptacidiphilus sp. MAP12-33]
MIGLCDRWHKLPSEVLAEDVGVLQLLEIAALGRLEQSEEVM